VYSLNVPLPGPVAARAGEIARDLPDAEPRDRGARTLVVKRLGTGDAERYHAIEARVREALAGTAPFAARVDRVDVFETVPVGTAPVVYLAVESPGLVALHDRLCDVFERVDDIEGEGYVPHVTVARGGSLETARAVAGSIDPIEWAVDELALFDAERGQFVSRVSLPA
jgi:2'-5' RNA ligase